MSRDDYVDLKNGPTVPLAVVVLAVDLEARGFRFILKAGSVTVTPAAKLTDDDKAQITRWRQHLAGVVAYRAPDVP